MVPLAQKEVDGPLLAYATMSGGSVSGIDVLERFSLRRSRDSREYAHGMVFRAQHGGAVCGVCDRSGGRRCVLRSRSLRAVRRCVESMW